MEETPKANYLKSNLKLILNLISNKVRNTVRMLLNDIVSWHGSFQIENSSMSSI